MNKIDEDDPENCAEIEKNEMHDIMSEKKIVEIKEEDVGFGFGKNNIEKETNSDIKKEHHRQYEKGLSLDKNLNQGLSTAQFSKGSSNMLRVINIQREIECKNYF